MQCVLDFTRASARGDDRALECQRLEHLLAGYQAFLGHDLANQLVAVQAFARLLQEQLVDGLDDEGHILLGRLAALARRADQHARRLADIGRLLREPPSGPSLPFAEVCAEAIAEVKSAPRGSISTSSMDYHVVEEIGQVNLSRRLIHHVLVELLHNAGAACLPNRPGRIEIEARAGLAEDPAGSGIILVVRDNGRGISEQEAARLGEIGTGAARAAAEQGNGLGLFLVVGAVARWRGQLNLRSEIDQGTTMVLLLPEANREDSRDP
jgi:signal transduction histidine kinase